MQRIRKENKEKHSVQACSIMRIWQVCLSLQYHQTTNICIYRVTQKRELLKNPSKIEEIQEKKIIDRNWPITTYFLRDRNPNYQCLKITSCRWRPPPRMHSFPATMHFKITRSIVSLCVCCMLCRMRLCRILQRKNLHIYCATYIFLYSWRLWVKNMRGWGSNVG